ncbi:hypothetical protein [Actinophytocola oryzae]|uniref:Acetyltransferase (GNAT) family protein n=1 Tax=Actinophytocola oryzae TaxID=502181 RepID=A0A4R7V196_9PSEU|nr:hypothetical protein [Actinophytocola oryzae]TDV42267.1 hypothetical protein CLV71_118137 [Actinophytocola oryzae]
MPTRLETRDLAWRDTWRAARLLADAYADGAIWAAAGRMTRWQRQVSLTLLYLAELLICRWEKGFAIGAARGDRLEGVLISYTAGERPTPWWGWVLRAPACLFAGPVAVARCVRISGDLERLKPREPHVWHAVLGRRGDTPGVGYVLLRAGQARADSLGLPGYLETSAGDEQVEINVLLGWSVVDEYVLRTGKVVRTMWRDCPALVTS